MFWDQFVSVVISLKYFELLRMQNKNAFFLECDIDKKTTSLNVYKRSVQSV